jgi:hypothetical protein
VVGVVCVEDEVEELRKRKHAERDREHDERRMAQLRVLQADDGAECKAGERDHGHEAEHVRLDHPLVVVREVRRPPAARVLERDSVVQPERAPELRVAVHRDDVHEERAVAEAQRVVEVDHVRARPQLGARLVELQREDGAAALVLARESLVAVHVRPALLDVVGAVDPWVGGEHGDLLPSDERVAVRLQVYHPLLVVLR